MNVSTTMLVVIMFTSIVGIGIGTILGAFAQHVSAMKSLSGRWLGALWLLILLLTYLDLFWSSLQLMRREEWDYFLFLFVILGPITLHLAGSLMVRSLSRGPDTADEGDTDRSVTRFFWLFAAVQLWFIGMDFVLELGWSAATSVSAALCAIAILMALIRIRALVFAFTLLVLALTLADIALK